MMNYHHSGGGFEGEPPQYEYEYEFNHRQLRHHPHHHSYDAENDYRRLHYHRNSTEYGPANYTITTSVSIRVTPLHDHFVSWGILWSLFVIASGVAAYQVYQEYRALKASHRRVVGGGVAVEDDVGSTSAGEGEGETSTADTTRSIFRRLLLLAIVARSIMMPVQLWSWPIWWQFVGDTLPEMVFASAWCLLVTFFVQLVGVATGSGTNTSPGIVIQATAYVVYLGLIITQLFDMIASVLIYALLCVIYAALFGIVIYYCPRLLTLLQPSLARHSGLAWRLIICTVLTIFVFAAHAVDYALLVVAPPKTVYWWWMYGTLELLPSVVFLAMMNPNPNKNERHNHHHIMDHDVAGAKSVTSSSSSIRRVDSSNSNSRKQQQQPAAQETSTLLKPGSGYGSVVVETASPII